MSIRPAPGILALALAQSLIILGAGLAAEDLPVTKVALYSSGVGYFEHRGSIKGDVTVPLPFSTAEVDDALKSLVARDPAATEASGSPTVSYPSLETVDETLRGLRIDLSASPTVPALLGRLRGAELEVQAPETVLGRIVSVEKRPTGKDGQVRDTLVLLTAKGVVAFALDEIASFRFTDPAAMADFNRALALVLGARDADRRQLDLRFPGGGSREVSFGYIVAAPVWKVSYRLDLSGSQPWIQGWAIVDNPSKTDWRNVSLSLVSGRPVSFIQNLYPPLRLGRPVLPLSIAGTAEARIFESRSTTWVSSRSLLFARSFSVAITCATELFNSGTRSRMSRIVCCSMSSGFSVDSIIPPKRARIEREILLISPILSVILHQKMYDRFPGSQIPTPVYVR